MADLAYPLSARTGQGLLERLNGEWHERALWIYMAVVGLHWVEHLTQAFQIWVLGMPRPESKGALGFLVPWLVSSEVLHFGYALIMFVGLIALLPGFAGAARSWWIASLAIQTWHFFEHSLLQGQAIAATNLFGSPVPMSIMQQFVPRPELHLIYNAAVFIPMVVAAVLHTRPTKPGAPAPTCTCAD